MQLVRQLQAKPHATVAAWARAERPARVHEPQHVGAGHEDERNRLARAASARLLGPVSLIRDCRQAHKRVSLLRGRQRGDGARRSHAGGMSCNVARCTAAYLFLRCLAIRNAVAARLRAAPICG